MVDAVLAMFAEEAMWLTSFDVLLLRAQEQHSLRDQDVLRAAHCLWCRIERRIQDRSDADVQPVGEGVRSRRRSGWLAFVLHLVDCWTDSVTYAPSTMHVTFPCPASNV